MNKSLLRAARTFSLPLSIGTALAATLLASASPMLPAPPPLANPMAIAQPPPGSGPSAAKEMVEYRQAVMIILRNNFAPLGGMAIGRIAYDPAVVQLRASRVAMLATMVPEGFTAATQGEKSRAKSQIWTNRAGFDQHAKDLVTRSETLAQLPKGDQTNSAGFQHAVQAVGSACKDCHDDFRSR